MYKVTFTNAHLENRTIECRYDDLELSSIPVKGSTLTLEQVTYRVGDAHWSISYNDSPMNRGRNADVSVQIELFPVPFN
jgi:hypothetical protein